MDMLKQMRVRFSGIGEEEKGGSSSNTRDKTIPPQKTQSFKDTKRTPSWLYRQFIRTMSRDYDSSDVEYPAAVAAAAFAVKSVEDKSGYYDHRRTHSGGADKPATKIKGKPQDIAKRPEKFSDEGSKLPDKSLPVRSATINPEPVKSVPSIKKTPTFGDNKPGSEVAEQAKRVPSMKKTLTLSDQSTDIRAPKTPEVPVSDPALKPTRPSSSQTRQSSSQPGSGNSKADIWEKEKMEKIRERYKKLIKEIVEWETKKKQKARRKLDRIEAELDRRRAKAMTHFNNEVGRIESIAGGAREQADQHRINKELKVIEKANKIRSTGKMPSTCSCF
ncbi:uncharacterized protein At3g61260-like isoform X2 [Lycium barbarum]|uniref:uncharacterized protein At3g61260-like isoform X2 n=1 Tax=Lycium barbarum TaxID=112863 RepID=UPI00293E1A74|nr:uncharacterized protein At3g61260-like isoform X2 [Lycium barbarum]